MDLFGIGALELLVILLVAVVILGPARMVDMARSAGTFVRDAQRTLREAADAATAPAPDAAGTVDVPVKPPATARAPVAPAPEAVAREDGIMGRGDTQPPDAAARAPEPGTLRTPHEQRDG